MKKSLVLIVGLLMTTASFASLKRFQCKAEHENKFRRYALTLDIILTESLKAIVEVGDENISPNKVMTKKVPTAYYGALVKGTPFFGKISGEVFQFGDRSNLSIQFSSNEKATSLNEGESLEPWFTYRTIVYVGPQIFEIKDEFRGICTRVVM